MPFGPQAQEKFVDSRKSTLFSQSSGDSSFTCHPVTHHLFIIIYSLSGDSSFTRHPMIRHLLIIR